MTDDDRIIRDLSDAIVAAYKDGDDERLERLKAQWAYACTLRDWERQHPDPDENTILAAGHDGW